MDKKEHNREMQSSIGRHLWGQFAKAMGKDVIFTKHLLLAQQLVSNSAFVYPASTNISEVAFIWNGKLYLGKFPKIASIVPFLYIRSLANNNTTRFDDVVDLLNAEFPSSDNMDIEDIVIGIKGNGFINFNPSFDLRSNKNNLMIFYKDSYSLVKFFDFFVENVDSSCILNSERKEIDIAFASPELNVIINQCVESFREKRIGK